MKIHHLFAAALAFSPTAIAASEPVAESLAYKAYIGGLPLGTLELKIAMDADRYATEASFDIGSLLRWALDTDARASSGGALSDGALVPSSFKYWVRDGKKERNAEMKFGSDGNVTEVFSAPEFRQRSYDVGLDEVRGAIDPATAVAMLSAPRESACDVSIKIFDGRKLHRITMKPSGGTTETPKCAGRYERLGGFKPKYMTAERRAYTFDAELKLIGPNRWRPQRLTAKTQFGNAVALLRN